MSKKSSFRGPLDKQHGKHPRALLKSASQHFYHIHWSLVRTLCSKNFLLLTCKILGLLVSRWAINETELAHHKDNLTIPIQMILSKEQKTFSKFFPAFLKSRLNFEHFE